jgi:hypothetical protein
LVARGERARNETRRRAPRDVRAVSVPRAGVSTARLIRNPKGVLCARLVRRLLAWCRPARLHAVRDRATCRAVRRLEGGGDHVPPTSRREEGSVVRAHDSTRHEVQRGTTRRTHICAFLIGTDRRRRARGKVGLSSLAPPTSLLAPPKHLFTKLARRPPCASCRQ